MQSTDDLKLFALFYVNEHENLSTSEKKYFYNFIEKVNEQQIKNLLITGKPVENLKEIEAYYGGMPMGDLWKAVGKSQGFTAGFNAGMVKTLAVSAFLAFVATVAAKAYQRFLSKAAIKCKDLKGIEKTNCMAKVKKMAQQAKINELQKGLALCSKSKKPGTCSDKMKHKIAVEKAKMGEL